MLVFIKAKKGQALPYSCLKSLCARPAYPEGLRDDPTLKDFVQYEADADPDDIPEVEAFCREHGFDFWID